MIKKNFVLVYFLILLISHAFASDNTLLEQGHQKLLLGKWKEASDIFFKDFTIKREEYESDPNSLEKEGDFLEATCAAAYSFYKLGEFERKDCISVIMKELWFRRKGGANLYCILLVQEMSPLKNEIKEVIKAQYPEMGENELEETAKAIFRVIRIIEKIGK